MSEDKKYIELQLYHDKVQAEINNLLAQTARANIETDKMRAETAKANTERDKMMAETAKANIERDKMLAETAKVYKEIKWYEIVIIVSATLAVVAIVKFLYSAN